MGEAHHAVFVGIGSGEKSGTAGAAGGVDAEVLAEKDALFGEMLEIWGCDGMAIGLDVAARIVGMEIEDIGGGIHNLVLGVMTLSDAPVEHYEWGGVQGQVENCHWGQDACAGEKGISPELLLGIGLDQFYFHYNPKFNRGYIDPKLAADPAESNTSHPHNVVLDLWLRMGILGLITFGLIMLQTLLRACRIWFSNHAQRWIALGCGAALLVGLIHGLVDQGYFSPDLAMVTWLFVGCVDGVFKNIEHRT